MDLSQVLIAKNEVVPGTIHIPGHLRIKPKGTERRIIESATHSSHTSCN